MAPELLRGDGYDFRVDVWNIAMLTYMMLTCSVPFQNEVERDNGVWSLPFKIDFSIEIVRFLNELFRYDPKYRPFPDELAMHPYF